MCRLTKWWVSSPNSGLWVGCRRPSSDVEGRDSEQHHSPPGSPVANHRPAPRSGTRVRAHSARAGCDLWRGAPAGDARCLPFVDEGGDEQAAEGDRAERRGMPQEEEERRQPDEHPLRARRARGSSDDCQVAHGEYPPERAEDGEPEHPWLQRGPVVDDLEHGLLLRCRKVACALHREPGSDAGQRVVGAEVDEEDAHAEPGLPCARAMEQVRQDEHRYRHQTDQPQLDHVEAHEPGGGVHQGLDVVVRVRMEDAESGKHERRCEEEHAPRPGRKLKDLALPCVRAGVRVAHVVFPPAAIGRGPARARAGSPLRACPARRARRARSGRARGAGATPAIRAGTSSTGPAGSWTRAGGRHG